MDFIKTYIIWIVTIVFAAGLVYAGVINIPSLSKRTEALEVRVSIVETHYGHIQDSLSRIEKKIDRSK